MKKLSGHSASPHHAATRVHGAVEWLTKEDLAINRAVAKRVGSWGWLDHKQPSYQHEITERALGVTGNRVGFSNIAKTVYC